MSTQLIIFFQGIKYKYNYSYNENTTFSDLLESFAFNYANLSICPCYKFQHFDKINSYKDVDANAKVGEFLSRFFMINFKLYIKMIIIDAIAIIF